MRGLASSVPYNHIDEQAARWAARTSGGALPAGMAEALEAWLSEDRRHRGAYFRARAGLEAIDDSLRHPRTGASTGAPLDNSNDNEDPGSTSAGATGRRNFRLALGGALAASLIGAITLGSMTSAPLQSQSGSKSAHALNLADGSVATLAGDAQIKFGLIDGTRKVRLLKGEAVFQVAKDAAHPFVVQSGDVFAQATGTIYSVRRVGQTGAAVRVDEGSVLVWRRGHQDKAVLLRAGGALTLEPAPSPADTQIVLDDVSISAAAARFNRVNHTQIIIADPAIGQIKIVGLFQANDPDQFAKSAAAVSEANIEYNQNYIVIKSK